MTYNEEERRGKLRLHRRVPVLPTCAAVLIMAGAWSLYLAAVSPPAQASTLGGTATITDPSLNALSSGGSTTPFSVALPANAACSGDTATDGYHVYSYLVPKGTDVTTVTFTAHPSVGYGLVNNTGIYYGPINTAIITGQIVSIPDNFEWAPLLTDGASLTGSSTSLLYSGTSGVWEAGLACATSAGVLSDYWNTEVTFTASSSDPNGFVWSAVPGVPGGSTTTTTSGAGTTGTTGTGTTTTAGTGTTTTTTSGTGTTGTATTTTTAGNDTTTTSTTEAGTGTTGTGTTTTTTAGTATTTTTTVAGVTTTTGLGTTVTAAQGSTSPVGASDTGEVTAAPTSANSSSLPLTGLAVRRDVALGTLSIGIGMILVGVSVRRRRMLRLTVTGRRP